MMTRLMACCALTAFAGATTGCMSVAQSIPTRTPVLVGPVDHIGGTAQPFDEDPPDEAEFDQDNQMSVFVAADTAFPTVSITRPNVIAVDEAVERAYAFYAGKTKLREVAPRLTHIGVGAYEMFFAGSYGHNFWWNASGHVQAVK